MNYIVPDEFDFFTRGFGFSAEHDPNECLFSYIYHYDDGSDLIFTHSPSFNHSVSVKLIKDKEPLFYIYQENLSRIEFQTWESYKIIRVYLSQDREMEFRLSFFPKPNLYFSSFN